MTTVGIVAEKQQSPACNVPKKVKNGPSDDGYLMAL
jgi:hypothetical protein